MAQAHLTGAVESHRPGLHRDPVRMVEAAHGKQYYRSIDARLLQSGEHTQVVTAFVDLAGLPDMSLEQQRAAIKWTIRRIVVKPAGRGKRFDPSLIEIEWR